MSQITLFAQGINKDDQVFGIPHPNKLEVVPYWISNPTGATITKIKVMGLSVAALSTDGGTLSVKIYSTPATDMPEILTKRDLEDSTLLDQLNLSLNNYQSFKYATKWVAADIVINTDCFIYGVMEVIGDVAVQQTYVWIDYNNNAI